jgi:ubiquinol-cytochrome c reductase cytochrome c subunit
MSGAKDEPRQPAKPEEGPFVSDDFDPDDVGFAPAISQTGKEASEPERAPRGGRRRRWRRRVASGMVLLAALASMGGLYALFASSSGAGAQAATQADVNAGQQLFQVTCITCHGANLEGVVGRGPSLVSVGAAAVYFQVSTGRMPLGQQGPEAYRKPAKFTEQEVEQLAAYVETFGGGPAIPTGDLRAGDLGAGGELFRVNCAQCHGISGKGAPLSAGKVAPGLEEATDKQIYTAMLTGPENMPIFSDNQLTPEQKRSIVNYVQTIKASKDPGGSGIDRIGPVSEGLVIWIVGVGVLMGTILWIGAKA